jgi:tyrosyl-tRNA synthetase
VSNEEKFTNFCKNKGSLYIGADPSAVSFHLGNYLTLIILKRAALCGHKSYGLIGGITGMIGDPRDPKLTNSAVIERKLLEKLEIEKNVVALTAQLQHFNATATFNNLDFYKEMKLWDYLRDVGKLINVNYMLEKDVIARRLTTGISYAEFSYTLLQGYDFLHLFETENIVCQMGGSDQ